ncbi:Uroporphyrinogen decarboxylase [compost metagenome]
MELIKEQAKVIIDEGIKDPGYIFNLGHGLFPEASLDKLKELTAYIHEYSTEALKTGVTVSND